MRNQTDVTIIGGGAAGLAAALGAAEEGAHVLLVERKRAMGGVLNQCIHNGFGLHYFREDFTGPEFREILEEKIATHPEITLLLSTTCLGIGRSRQVYLVNQEGLHTIETKTVVIATGAQERPLSGLGVAGRRPSGIFSAGLVQEFINLYNLKPGNSALIVGSGDIGLIMARRLHLEGISVKGVIEIMSYPGGLGRNIQQCLNDFGIPLYLGRSVKKIEGKRRVEHVTTAAVDDELNFIEDTEQRFQVDTLISSVGLIPNIRPFTFLSHDNGFLTTNTHRTSRDWIFAAGNCTTVFDLVDDVATQGKRAGKLAAREAQGQHVKGRVLPLEKDNNIAVVHPTSIEVPYEGELFLRVRRPFPKLRIVIPAYRLEKIVDFAVPSEMIKIKLAGADKEMTGSIRIETYELD